MVFLFGSHLVYCEIAALAGLLMARLPVVHEGQVSGALRTLTPVALSGALVLLLGGVLARAIETRGTRAAFRYGDTAGVYPFEREPDGRRFRWTGPAAAWRLGAQGTSGPARVVLPVRNARPDGGPVTLDVFWEDAFRSRLELPPTGWQSLEVPVSGPGVLRLRVRPAFRPNDHTDSRRLGIEVGEIATLP